MEVPLAGDRQAVLGGGQLLSAISTRVVAILREHYGRGPMKAKTYALDDLIVAGNRPFTYRAASDRNISSQCES